MMQKRIRRELRKNRELLWHFLDGETCFFCHRPLLDVHAKNIRFGDASAQPLDVAVTIHHKNGNHSDNRKQNRKLAHQSCHKRHHAIHDLNANRSTWSKSKSKVTSIRRAA